MSISFDVVIKTQTDIINAVEIIPNVSNVGLMGFESKKPIFVSHMHKLLGHMGNDQTCYTAKMLGYQISGNVKDCEQCGIDKAKQKTIPKFAEHTFDL